MNAREELFERLLERRCAKLGTLSQGAREELAKAIERDPAPFVDGTDDEAFFMLVQALERHARAQRDEDLIDDDDAYFEARARRLDRLIGDCHAALAVDAGCMDAALVAIMAADEDPASTLGALLELRSLGTRGHAAGNADANDGTAWSLVRERHRLRTTAAIARACLESGHYRMAVEACDKLLATDAADHVGARRTCALALARLEDEDALDALDLRFGRRGDTWFHLARSILHFKLDHIPAARRAMTGYARLVDGGAYALLRPVAVDTYLPDRPDVAAASYVEATLAIWEAEPIIVDVPDFPFWAAVQPGVGEAAQAFALRNGFDW